VFFDITNRALYLKASFIVMGFVKYKKVRLKVFIGGKNDGK
jgi:hypothetical protein